MADSRELEASRILMLIIRSLVDDPGAIHVEAQQGIHGITFHVKANGRNLGQLIGHSGRNARSIAVVLQAIGNRHKQSYNVSVGDAKAEHPAALPSTGTLRP